MNNERQKTENLYCLLLGKRYTYKQKRSFLVEISKEFRNLNYKTKIIKERRIFVSNYHLIVGDLEKAKTVIVAHYDTPRKLAFSNNVYYPFDGRKNMTKLQREKTICMIIGVFLLLFELFFFSRVVNGVAIKITSMMITVLFLIELMNGSTNAFNYDRNTGSIIYALELARNIKRADVAYLFPDDCCENYYGLAMYYLSHKEMFENKHLIILDCISGGKEIFGFSNNNKVEFNKDIIKCPEIISKQFTPISFVDKCTYLTSGEAFKNQVIVNYYNTEIDYDRLSKIIKIINDLLD